MKEYKRFTITVDERTLNADERKLHRIGIALKHFSDEECGKARELHKAAEIARESGDFEKAQRCEASARSHSYLAEMYFDDAMDVYDVLGIKNAMFCR